ncbi:alkaline phosphatase D family protein [Hydrogenophaga sp.]|uniref:alkaline phosphatase D family protein n=1 Tax=Hydrogenophaga sp. TaxID=1904254 RepID=UPI002603E1DE|nr:alkaline phosphatase D family protein [Hydrogenophaga sp.]MDM7950849.1 alkaline phosphatase D family protein [Hydrogenophaga sp.]
MAIDRRRFMIHLASASAVATSGKVMASDSHSAREEKHWRRIHGPIEFNYGVASGDPLADRVILWTHAHRRHTPIPIRMRWEVSLDARFRRVVSSGWTVAHPDNGHTVKVDATNLRPGHTYFYRFRTLFDVSPVGVTRTLPEKGVQGVKLAVFSCSNYPAGFFHAYSEAVRAGAQYAVHLGDYIYEYAADGYASEDAGTLGRVSQPRNELLSLDDYRRRYAQYRSDPDLKQMHARLPMIAIWDDHEIANDTWTDGAENHTEGEEGAFGTRVAAALKAYHEWMPIRTPDVNDLKRGYRSFDFGDLLSLHMLETRLLGREQPIDIVSLVNPETAPEALAALTSPTREMLGTEQLNWLQQRFIQSDAVWQVLGQQVLMARMEFPVSILTALNPANTSPEAIAAGERAVQDYLTAKAIAAANPAALTPLQQALLDPRTNPRLGYNLDAWDGYPAAREMVLGTASALGKRLVSLAGDTHNAWYNELRLIDGTLVGEEFATPSVSSPGLEQALATLSPAQTTAIFRGVIDTLKFTDTFRRGFLLMHFTQEAAQGEWYFLDTVKSQTYKVSKGFTGEFSA